MGDSECCWLVYLLPTAMCRVLISSVAVYNKLIVTTLKYTPVVLAQHVPYKEVGGK